MTVVGAIDCGTNSIRLLVSADGRDIARVMRIVRLGEGVDETGRLGAEGLARTRAALVDYAGLLAQHGVERTRMVATSATRDASNRDEFVAMVRGVLGIDPEVVTGQEEARLSYAGATAALGGQVQWPVLVADIGGGSTEVILGDAPLVPRAARSVDIGCVRLTERRLHSDPPTPAELAAAAADIEAALDRAAEDVPLSAAATCVGLAGSVTTVVAHALSLPRYDPEVIHGARVPREQIETACRQLIAMSRAERAALPFMHPGRVDVIGGGALVVAAVTRRSGCDELVASERDILDGIAADLAGDLATG